MHPTAAADHDALDPFGGCLGICALYFAVLAFPICHLWRRPAAEDKKSSTARQSRQLRVAGIIIVFTSLLWWAYPSHLFLLPHVAERKQIAATALDWSVQCFLAFVLAPLAGRNRLYHIAKTDCENLEREIPDPSLVSWTPAARRRVNSITRKHFASSLWLLLFTLYFLNTCAGGVQVCLGFLAHREIAWYAFPLYNLAGHLAVFITLTAFFEVLGYVVRVRAVEAALECGGMEERAAFWCWLESRMGTVRLAARLMFGQR